MPCLQIKWRFACGCENDRRRPGEQLTVEACPKHISGSELCQPLELALRKINEVCADCEEKRAKEKKREAGGRA